ncbi:MAG: hypothetical protein AB7V56_12625 [Candidatus Nitrosocosmicus sp.]
MTDIHRNLLESEEELIKYFNYLIDAKILKLDLSMASRFALLQFLKKHYLSTYEVCKILESSDYSADYKNIHKKIKKLLSLGLLYKMKPERMNKIPEHGSIYYEITSAGLIYLLSHVYEDEIELADLEKFEGDGFFKLLIHNSSINIKSLKNLKSFEALRIFINFFREIAQCVITELKDLEEVKRVGYYEIPGSRWSHFLKYDPYKDDEYRDEVCELLYSQYKQHWDYDLDWIKDTEIIEKRIIDDTTIEFYSNENALLFKIDETKTKASVISNGEELGWYTVKRENGDFIIYHVLFDDVDSYFRRGLMINLSRKIEKLLTEFKLSIIRLSYYKYEYGYFDGEKIDYRDQEIIEIENDVKLLANDRDVLHLISSLKENIDKIYTEFMKYKSKD